MKVAEGPVISSTGRIFRHCAGRGWPVVVLLLSALWVGVVANGQTVAEPPERETIDADRQLEIIDSLTQTLNEYYVFPEVAEEMERYVRRRFKDKEYKGITDAAEFAEALTTDLREVCHDRHLGLRWIPPEQMALLAADTASDEIPERQLAGMRRRNFDFRKLEWLEGNVGYLDLRGFNDATWAGETAVAAMNWFAHCDAMIIDLRNNGGGSPSMIQLISSYFFDEPVHLNSFYIRKEDSIKQFWTSAHVQGKRMTDVDLYVLTSRRTFSAAEEFTYNMKNLERATIIGETTGGGAHPVDQHLFPSLNIGARVPFGRAINPVTGTNWEGTGVTPHIDVPQEEALTVAHLEALEKLADGAADEDRGTLDWAIAGLKAKLHPVEVDPAVLQNYAGVYGPRTLTYEDGELFYQREDRPKYRMIPMAEDLFWFEDLDYFRLKVVMDDQGAPIELHGLYAGGHRDISVRDPGK